MQHAMNAVATDVADPGATIYHHRIELRAAVAYGKGGWLVRIADRTAGTRICVTDLPTQTAIGVSEDISVAPCRSAATGRPPQPAPSSNPPA